MSIKIKLKIPATKVSSQALEAMEGLSSDSEVSDDGEEAGTTTEVGLGASAAASKAQTDEKAPGSGSKVSPLKLRAKVPSEVQKKSFKKRKVDDDAEFDASAVAENEDDHIFDDDVKMLPKRKREVDEDSIDELVRTTSEKRDPFLGLQVPERYRAIVHQLTEQERLLLDRLTKSKKLVLKVPTRTSAAKLAARHKAHLESNRKRQPSVASKIVDKSIPQAKRPKIISSNSNMAQNFTGNDPAASLTTRPPKMLGEIAKGRSINMLSSECDEEGVIMLADWHTTQNKEPLVLELPNLQLKANGSKSGLSGNTVVVWCTMPEDSERFCINLAPSKNYKENDPNTVFLYHFNPRDGWGKKNIMQNTFARGEWGTVDKSIQTFPITKGKRFELRITIHENEFHVFLDGKPLSEFKSRTDPRYLQDDRSLYLIVPLKEDHYGDKEDVKVHGVWWGNRSIHGESNGKSPHFGNQQYVRPGVEPPKGHPLPPRSSVSTAPGGSTTTHIRPRITEYEERKLHVSGLPIDTKEAFAEMKRLFQHYDIENDQNGQSKIIVIEGKGFGFVTLTDTKNMEEAIKFLHGKPSQAGSTLSVSRARKKNRKRF